MGTYVVPSGINLDSLCPNGKPGGRPGGLDRELILKIVVTQIW